MSAYQIGSIIGTFIGVLVGAVAAWLLYKYLGKSSRASGNGGATSANQSPARKVAPILGICAIFFLTGFAALIRSHFQQNSSHTYPQALVDGFTKGCVNNAKVNVDLPTAERVCACAITEIQRAYTFGEFKTMAETAEKTREVPAGWQTILTSCSQKQSHTDR